MAEVYDLHRHTHFVAFCIKENTINRGIHSTSARKYKDNIGSRHKNGSHVIYDKQKLKVLSLGRKRDNEDEDTIQIDISEEKLHRLFKKDKDCWNEDDLFFFKAVSDFIRLSVKELMENRNKVIKQIEDTDALHYVFVVPSEWEEEIREVLIRPIFVQANLISEDDHQDRLLFCNDVESTYYFIIQHRCDGFKLSRNTIIGVIDIVEESKVLIKLDSILIVNPLFDFFNSLLSPKLMASNSSFLTTNDVKNGIREFIKITFSFNAQEDTIQNIMEEINPNGSNATLGEDKASSLEKPFITDKILSKLDKKLGALIKSIRPIDICAEISKYIPNNLKLLLQNDPVKEYSILSFIARDWDRKVDKGLLDWSEYLFEYNRISFGSNYIIPKRPCIKYFDRSELLAGATQYLSDALQNSDVYSKPRILSTEHLATSSSIFLKSKPDAIMNIDISLESTMLSFSLLDGNGLVKEIWNHNYFVPDTHLRSLGSFFNFSEETTLNVKKSFIAFVDKYFMYDTTLFFIGEYGVFDKCIEAEIEDILNVEGHDEDLLVSTQQQVYIKAFVRIYTIYINDIVSRKLSTITEINGNTKIGYAISIDSMLLKRLFGTEDDLREVIYASNLVQKDDSSKKLRIAIHAEGLFHVIQQYFNLQFPVKSFFVAAQLYEDYVQLTLNQIVTESGLENEYQEAIIMQEQMIPIPNIYKSLCFKMWNNITEDNSLIQLCDKHEGNDGNESLKIFSLENRAEFTNNLKEFISKNVLNKSLNEQIADKATISLSTSCNCRVCLTVNDITEISFRPVLQDIISLIFSSLINKQLFGKYRNIQYVFHLIRFNYNLHFQNILLKLLKDETDHFLYDERIDIVHYIIPKSPNQLSQPVLWKEPFSYKAFQVGVLYHVYSENYGFGFKNMEYATSYMLKNKISDSKITSIDKETVLPLFKKGNKIKGTQIKRVFYLSSGNQNTITFLKTKLFRLKKADTLSFDETVHTEDQLEKTRGPGCFLDNPQQGYTPFIISILFKGDSSSISLAVKKVSEEIDKEDCATLAEPMTLARF